MNRRQALIALLSMPMGHFLAYKVQTAEAAGGAGLRIPLDEWGTLTVQHARQSLTFTAAEIFTALQKGSSS